MTKYVATAYGEKWCWDRCLNPRDCTAQPHVIFSSAELDQRRPEEVHTIDSNKTK